MALMTAAMAAEIDWKKMMEYDVVNFDRKLFENAFVGKFEPATTFSWRPEPEPAPCPYAGNPNFGTW
jgi:hypothetical protein